MSKSEQESVALVQGTLHQLILRTLVSGPNHRQVNAHVAAGTDRLIITLDYLVANSISRPRLYTGLLAIFAAISVTLAATGIYGLTAYILAHDELRKSEFAWPSARPADKYSASWLRQNMALAVVGIVFGCAGTAAITRYLERMLFGIKPFDTAMLLFVVTLFLLIAALLSYVPARRATKVDPVAALRCE